MTTLNDSLPCPICGIYLEVKPCHPSKAGKNSLHVRCPVDGRHLRGFIAHQPLVNDLLQRLPEISSPEEKKPGLEDSKGPRKGRAAPDEPTP